jgi:hypothetical protein
MGGVGAVGVGLADAGEMVLGWGTPMLVEDEGDGGVNLAVGNDEP